MVERRYQLDGHELGQTPGERRIEKDREAWHAAVYVVAKCQT